MPTRKRRPSLMGGLLWTGLGTFFLLRNFGIGPDFWSMAGRYWPILLILLGLGKVMEYFRQKEGISLRVGEVISIFFLLLIGSMATKVYNSRLRDVIRDLPVISLGEHKLPIGEWMGTSHTFSQDASYTVNAPIPLRVDNSYGNVTVTPGSDKVIQVRLKKIVYHDQESRAKEIADEIKLEGGPEGGAEATSFLVKTNRDALESKGYRFRTEMEVLIPRRSQLHVRNAFGEVRVSNLAGRLNLSTTHKQLEVRDCIGDVEVSNRYAVSRLLNLTGNVKVDARGRVYLETIKGDVNIRDEQSPVEITDVDGKVVVSNTESSITVEKVTKPVVVDARGSQITVRHLDDTLKVTNSHRGVQISDVASNVSLDSRYSTVSLNRVKGNVDVKSNADRITADDISGSLKIIAQGSRVRANDVAGPVEIATTLKDVIVNDFGSECKITNEFSDVTLSTKKLGKGDLTVKNRNGKIELFLPEDTAFQIDATARYGRVDSDFPGLEASRGSGETGLLRGKTKTGGPKIHLETDYNNISVRTRGGEGSSRSSSN